jgi:hypothetical protein
MAIEPAVVQRRPSATGNAVLSHLTNQPHPPLKETLRISLERLRPTQVAVGMLAVAAKREKLAERSRRPKKLKRFLAQRPIPAVQGPEGNFHIVDHHHLGLALWQSEIDCAFVQVIDDLSTMPRARFWSCMEAEGRLYPFDEQGRRISPAQLPASISNLKHDPFRDLAWAVRENGGFQKSGVPYSEFRWAQFFRDHFSERQLHTDFAKSLRNAMKLATRREAAALPGYRGK